MFYIMLSFNLLTQEDTWKENIYATDFQNKVRFCFDLVKHLLLM